MFSLYGFSCFRQFFCPEDIETESDSETKVPTIQNKKEPTTIKRNGMVLRKRRCIHSTPELSRITMPAQSHECANDRKKRIKSKCLRKVEANDDYQQSTDESIYNWTTVQPTIFTLRDEMSKTIAPTKTKPELVWTLNPMISQDILDNHFKQPEPVNKSNTEIHKFVDNLCLKVARENELARQLMDNILKTEFNLHLESNLVKKTVAQVTIATWITDKYYARKQARARLTIVKWIENPTTIKKQSKAQQIINNWIIHRYHIIRSKTQIVKWIERQYIKWNQARALTKTKSVIAGSLTNLDDWLVIGHNQAAPNQVSS